MSANNTFDKQGYTDELVAQLLKEIAEEERQYDKELDGLGLKATIKEIIRYYYARGFRRGMLAERERQKK